jgi:hypothetical protein
MAQSKRLLCVVAATGVVALVAAFDPGYPISTGLSPLTSISCFGLNLANWTTEDTNSDIDGCLFSFIAFGLYFSVAYPVLATLKGNLARVRFDDQLLCNPFNLNQAASSRST